MYQYFICTQKSLESLSKSTFIFHVVMNHPLMFFFILWFNYSTALRYLSSDLLDTEYYYDSMYNYICTMPIDINVLQCHRNGWHKHNLSNKKATDVYRIISQIVYIYSPA